MAVTTDLLNPVDLACQVVMAVTTDLLNPVDLAYQVGDGRHHGSPEPCGPGLSGW